MAKDKGTTTASDKGKATASELAKKEARMREKKKEAGALKLKEIKLQREELELEEKARRASLEESETLGVMGSRREKCVHDEEDESTDSNLHHMRRKTKVILTSDSEGEGNYVSHTRLSKLEKAMFGDMKFDLELIVTEEIEQYRPPPAKEKQFPKMT